MDTSTHNMTTLFDQLGLESGQQAIQQFIDQNRGLDPSMPLAKASFWNESQRVFLTEAISRDSDWAEIVDQLDALLRH